MEPIIQNMFGDNLENQIITNEILQDHLKKKGERSDLYMFLSGTSGAGNIIGNHGS